MMMKKISHTITVILVIFLLLTVTLTVSSKLSGGTPRILGYQVLEVLSGSMEPDIQTGSIIAVKPGVDPSQLKVGDIVTYKTVDNPNVLITHRIKEIQNRGAQRLMITKGDANDAADLKPVPMDNIIAKYANITIPYAGYFINFEKTKAGVISLLIIPGVLLVLWQVVSLLLAIFRMEDKDKKSKDVLMHDQTTQV